MGKFGKLERSNSWYSLGSVSYLKCPFPDCNHIAEVMTKAHCRVAHGMEREEVKRLYGMPYLLEVDMQKRFENLKEGSK